MSLWKKFKNGFKKWWEHIDKCEACNENKATRIELHVLDIGIRFCEECWVEFNRKGHIKGLFQTFYKR